MTGILSPLFLPWGDHGLISILIMDGVTCRLWHRSAWHTQHGTATAPRAPLPVALARRVLPREEGELRNNSDF